MSTSITKIEFRFERRNHGGNDVYFDVEFGGAVLSIMIGDDLFNYRGWKMWGRYGGNLEANGSGRHGHYLVFTPPEAFIPIVMEGIEEAKDNGWIE